MLSQFHRSGYSCILLFKTLSSFAFLPNAKKKNAKKRKKKKLCHSWMTLQEELKTIFFWQLLQFSSKYRRRSYIYCQRKDSDVKSASACWHLNSSISGQRPSMVPQGFAALEFSEVNAQRWILNVTHTYLHAHCYYSLWEVCCCYYFYNSKALLIGIYREHKAGCLCVSSRCGPLLATVSCWLRLWVHVHTHPSCVFFAFLCFQGSFWFQKILLF